MHIVQKQWILEIITASHEVQEINR